MNQLQALLTRIFVLSSALVTVAAVYCAPVSAATSVGYPLAGGTPDAWQAGTNVAQRRNTDSTGTTYGGFAVGGVLTSISVKTQGDPANISVSVLRKTADPSAAMATFLSVAASNIAVTADPTVEGHVTTVPARIPVNAGDRFAATTALMGTRYLTIHTASAFDYCFFSGVPQAVGESVVFDSSFCNNYMPLVEGSVEPDVDGDGYGDETQDLCSTDPGRFDRPCAIANLSIKAVKSAAKTGTSATTAFTITNTGDLSSGIFEFAIKAARSPKELVIIKGCKPRASTKRRACTLAGLAPGASQTVRVKWTPKSVLRVALTATVKTSSPESSVVDNAAKVTVKAKKPK